MWLSRYARAKQFAEKLVRQGEYSINVCDNITHVVLLLHLQDTACNEVNAYVIVIRFFVANKDLSHECKTQYLLPLWHHTLIMLLHYLGK